MVKKRYRADRDAIDRKRLPLAVKVFGVLCLAAGGATAVLLTITIVTMVLAFTSGSLDVEASTATVVIFVVETMLYTALATMFAIFGIRLLRNKRKHAAHGTEAMIFILAAIIICSIIEYVNIDFSRSCCCNCIIKISLCIITCNIGLCTHIIVLFYPSSCGIITFFPYNPAIFTNYENTHCIFKFRISSCINFY